MKPQNNSKVKKIESQYVFNDVNYQTNKNHEIQNQKELQYELLSKYKDNGWFNVLCQLTNANIFISQTCINETEIKIQLKMNEQLKFDFLIMITEGKDVFDYIPQNINFEFIDKIDDIFNESLEISKNDMGLFIERILEIRNNCLYK